MLSQAELNAIDLCIQKTAFNLTVDVQNASGTVLSAGLPAMVTPFETTARNPEANPNVLHHTHTLRCAFDGNIATGRRVKVKTVGGLTATTAQAVVYAITRVVDVLSFGRQLECYLWQLGFSLQQGVAVSQYRNGSLVTTGTADTWPFDPSAMLNLGANPGFRLQSWQAFLFAQPGPLWKVGDDLTYLGDTYNVAMVNSYDQTSTVVAWKFNWDCTISIEDTAGNVLISSWPAIIEPVDAEQAMTAALNVSRPSWDATLYCGADDRIITSKIIRVATVNGATARPIQAAVYSVQSRDDRFGFGKFLECRLTRKR